MKNKCCFIAFNILSVIILSLTSCAPIQKCGETINSVKKFIIKPEQLYTKRLKTIIGERDNLCAENKSLKKDTAHLNEKINSLINDNSSLEKKYYELANISEEKLVRLRNELEIKSNENANGKALNRRTEIILSPKLEELFKILY